MPAYGTASSAGNSQVQTRLFVSFSDNNVDGGYASVTIKIQYRRTSTATTTYFVGAPLSITIDGSTWSSSATFDLRSKTVNTWYDLASNTWVGVGTGRNMAMSYSVSLSGTSARSCSGSGTIPAFTITFNANGGSGSKSSHTQTYGIPKRYGANTFTRTGYHFLGWYAQDAVTGEWNGYNSAGTRAWYAQSEISSYYMYGDNAWTDGRGAGHNLTYYAQWQRWYVLDINGYVNGAQNNSMTTSMVTFTLYLEEGGAAKSYPGIADSSAYHMPGTIWKLTNIVAGSNYVLLKTGTISGTLNADFTTPCIWLGQKYTITYKANGGSGSDQSQTVNYGTSWTTKASNTFSRSGYSFTVWNTKADGSGTTYHASTAQTAAQNGNVTLYAIWASSTYAVNFTHYIYILKYQEGTNAAKNAILFAVTNFNTPAGQSLTLDASKAVAAPNGTALAKYISDNRDGSWVSENMPVTFTPTRAFSLNYFYVPIVYNITYNLNGGTNNSANPSTYNVYYGVTFQPPTKTGFKFVGWQDSAGNMITGINQGKNMYGAGALSYDALRAELASRTVGNVSVTAIWASNVKVFKDDQWTSGAIYVAQSDGSWKPGEMYMYEDGDWFAVNENYIQLSDNSLLVDADGKYIVE